MNAFEELVATCIAAEGYWAVTGYKVQLNSDDKAVIELPSAPRWELDVVAYSPIDNHVQVIECKSYLDSGGVDPRHFDPSAKLSGRYKLFTREKLWPVIKNRLLRQLEQERRILPGATISLGLAFGKAKQIETLRLLFQEKAWRLIEPQHIRQQLERLAALGWQNSTASIVAKLLLLHTSDSNKVPPNNPFSAMSDAVVEAHADALSAGSIARI